VLPVPVPFLPFFPPLWALLVFVAFLPEAVLGGVVVLVVPPPVWAKVRPAAINIVHTIVNSLFISFKSPLSFEREAQMVAYFNPLAEK